MSGFKYFLIMVLCCFSLSACKYNSGHRLGSDFSDLPENSLEVYREALNKLQHKNNFLYTEFDVQETSDGKLIVFHDDTFSRMVIGEPKKTVIKTSFDEARSYCLKQKTNAQQFPCVQIPTPQEVFVQSIQGKLSKPVMVEIKYISKKGKDLLLQQMVPYKEELDMNIIIAKPTFETLFSQSWCREFNSHGFEVMATFKKKNPRTNNLCEEFFVSKT